MCQLQMERQDTRKYGSGGKTCTLLCTSKELVLLGNRRSTELHSNGMVDAKRTTIVFFSFTISWRFQLRAHAHGHACTLVGKLWSHGLWSTARYVSSQRPRTGPAWSFTIDTASCLYEAIIVGIVAYMKEVMHPDILLQTASEGNKGSHDFSDLHQFYLC